MSERDSDEYLWDAYHDWVGDEAAAYRRALEDLDEEVRAELIQSASRIPAIPEPAAGHRALVAWVEAYTDSLGDFHDAAGAVTKAAAPVLDQLGYILDPPGVYEALMEALHTFATRLALLEARPYYELPAAALQLHDEFFEERYGEEIAVAGAVEHFMVNAFLWELEVTAAELQRRAEWHHAEAERLYALAAEARNRGEHTEAAELEVTAARHTEAGREAAAHAAALRRYCRCHRVPPPAYRRPRARTLCGHRVRTSAAPLAPNAPPTRAPRVRCAALSAA